MIDKGVNPLIVDYDDETQFEIRGLSSLKKLPTTKTAYFLTRPLVGNDVTKADFCDVVHFRVFR